MYLGFRKMSPYFRQACPTVGVYMMGIIFSTLSVTTRQNSFSFLSCSPIRQMYLSRSLSQRLKFSRTLWDCSSWVLMAGGIRPCIPRICLSLKVNPNSWCRKIERKNKQMSSMGGVGGQAVYLHPTLFLIHVLILQTST